jgi:hypothetical protein
MRILKNDPEARRRVHAELVIKNIGMGRRSFGVLRCIVCRKPSTWGGRVIVREMIEYHGRIKSCSVNGPHCRGCCVPRLREDIDRERSEAEAAVRRILG